ncbi:Protein of unknown function DUF3632 [Penicillium brevicompactum]|uniref:Uncharacterized protein n=1 Tax=Penicillium brevicompactum TaxID=5074 RepID=A0A9W9QU29_PENBR|nr:Protein of unknown function DUF3632 [Penicillium brevicompactum]
MAAPLHLHIPSLEDEDSWIIEVKYFAIINDFLQPGSHLSAAEAAAGINELTPMNREAKGEKAEEPISFLLEFWGTISKLARQIPHDHPAQDKMIEILKELQALPVVKVPISERGFLLFWSEMPCLTEDWTEFDIGPSARDHPSKFGKWINRQAFAARLLQAGLADLFHLPTCCFMDALEEEPSPRQEYFECQLRAAVQWIEYSRDILFHSLDNLPNFRTLRRGSLYVGKGGLSRERWDSWEARLRVLAESGTLTEETALICRKAAQQMAEMAVTADVSDEAAPAETATAEAPPAEVLVDTATAEAIVEAANAGRCGSGNYGRGNSGGDCRVDNN